MFTASFWRLLAVSEIPVLLGILAASKDGWLTPRQVRKRPIVPNEYLTYLEHPGVLGLMVLANPTAAYLVDTYGSQWTNVRRLMWVFLLVGTGWLVLIWMWTTDETPSALSHDKRPTVAAMCNFLSGIWTSTVVVMFYCFTPHPKGSIWWPTLGLGVYLWFGLVGPALVAHKKSNRFANYLFIAVCFLLIAAASRLSSMS